jgi:hypothetical protein
MSVVMMFAEPGLVVTRSCPLVILIDDMLIKPSIIYRFITLFKIDERELKKVTMISVCLKNRQIRDAMHRVSTNPLKNPPVSSAVNLYGSAGNIRSLF